MTSNETSNGSIPPLAHNFPSSTASPSAIFHFPGVTHESTELTRRVLEENDRTHDVFMKLRCEATCPILPMPLLNLPSRS